VTTSIAGFAIPAGNDFPTLGITVTLVRHRARRGI